jgi:hypothetical protein
VTAYEGGSVGESAGRLEGVCVLFMQYQRYHHGLWHPILSLGLWRGGNVTLNECWLLTAGVFVKRLLGFRGQVLG